MPGWHCLCGADVKKHGGGFRREGQICSLRAAIESTRTRALLRSECSSKCVQKAVQPIKTCKPWSSVRQAGSVCHNENTIVDLDKLRHLEEAMRLQLVALVDTLVPQVHIARQDGADACRNCRREDSNAIRHRVSEAYQDLL